VPKVSIVVSVYNSVKYIQPFLKSIELQSFQDFECILVDADSKDGTRDVLKQYARLNPKLKVIEAGFITIPAACNLGIQAAKGEYIARIDSDNFLFQSFLQDYVDYLDENPDIDFVIADQLKINQDDKVIGINPFVISDYALKKNLLFCTSIGGAPMAGRNKAFFDVGLYDERMVISEDRIFALKAMGTKKFGSINKLNYAYRIHGEAITRRFKKDDDHDRIVREYISKYIKLEDYYSDLSKYQDVVNGQYHFKPIILKKIANTILYCGLRLADLGQRTDGIKEIEKAKAFFPANSWIYNYCIWQIKRGRQGLESLTKKIDYWLPFNVDLMQLVIVKIIRKYKEDQSYWQTKLTEYQKLLALLKKVN